MVTRAKSGTSGRGTPRVPNVFYQFIQDALDLILPQRHILQFTGGLVAVTDDAANDRTVVDLSGTGTLTKEPTGWDNEWPIPPNATLALNDGTLELSVTAGVGGYSIYYQGAEIQKAAATVDTVNWTDDEGQWYFYFDGTGTLQATQSAATWYGVFLGDGIPVATLYWDDTNNQHIRFGEERHGFMPGPTHLELHRAFGARWIEGAEPYNMTADQNGALAADAQLGFTSGTVYDEDVRLIFTTGAPQTIAFPAQVPVFYLSGAIPVWRRRDANTFPLIYSGDGSGYVGANGRIPFNENNIGTWVLTEIGQNNFVCVHYYLTTDIEEPYIAIQGQVEYTSIAAARSGAEIELAGLFYTLPLLGYEATPLASLIFQSRSTYGNVPKARVRTVATGLDYIDWRQSPLSGSPDSSAGQNANLKEKTGEAETSGAAIATVVELSIPDGYFGALSIDLAGEHVGTPADCYDWQKWIAVSGEGGAATIRDASLIPNIINPSAKGIVVTVDTAAENVRLRVTGVVGEDYKWVGHLGLLFRGR